jgi:hypothetical protein
VKVSFAAAILGAKAGDGAAYWTVRVADTSSGTAVFFAAIREERLAVPVTVTALEVVTEVCVGPDESTGVAGDDEPQETEVNTAKKSAENSLCRCFIP